MKRLLVIILTTLFVVVLFGGVYMKKGMPDKVPALTDASIVSEDSNSTIYDEVVVKIGEKTFWVLVADTLEKRALGLSGREKLPSEHGMLFAFGKLGDYPFWMKDMNFAIDILWINENEKIVHILEYIAPETYPEAFTSPKEALYVLELPEGTVEQADIKLGDKVVWD